MRGERGANLCDEFIDDSFFLEVTEVRLTST